MADSNVYFDPGTGVSKVPFDTRTESTNSEHRQVVVIGDPSTNAGVAPVDSTKGVAVDLTNTGSNSNAINVAQSTAAAVTAGWPTTYGQIADVTGTFTNATQTNSVTTGTVSGYSTFFISISGTYGTASGTFEVTDDGGSNWYNVNAYRIFGATFENSYNSLSNSARAWLLNCPGVDQVRVRSTAVASGTVNVRITPCASPAVIGSTVQLAASPATIGSLAANQSVNVAQVNGTTTSTGNGTTGSGTQRVTISSDSTGVISLVPQTSGGVTPVYLGPSGGTKYTIKGSAGQIYGWHIYNNNSSVSYVQVFDYLIDSVTLGSTTPAYTIGIPANSFSSISHPTGIQHSNAIVIATTTTPGGSTGPTNILDVNFFYK